MALLEHAHGLDDVVTTGDEVDADRPERVTQRPLEVVGGDQ